MTLTRLRAGQVSAGIPVAVDCYDGQGHLILKRGVIVDSARQVEYLLERGLFAADPDADPAADSADEAVAASLMEHASSPFKRLSECYFRLETLLLGSSTPATELGSKDVSATAFPSPTELLADFLDGKDIAFTAIDADQPHPFPGQIQQLTIEIQAVCQADADAVIGAIHRNTIGLRYSISHSLNRALICELLAVRSRIPPRNRRQLLAAALTCDLALLQLQDELVRHEGPLRPEQQRAIAQHPQQAVELLAALGANDPSWTNAVIQHHEFPNGKGYPAGLSGAEISPWARILKLADTYGAMVSRRSYRKALHGKDVFRQLFQKRGTEFDEDLAALFVNEFGVFPPGLIVRLHNGEQAVVIRRDGNPRTPTVKSILGARGAMLSPPVLRSTAVPGYEIVEVLEGSALSGLDMDDLWGYPR